MNAVAQRFEREFRGYRSKRRRRRLVHKCDAVAGRSRWRQPACVARAAVFSGTTAADRVCKCRESVVDAFGASSEFAIRAALGASRWRIVRELAVEGLVLATLAAALGLLFVNWGIKLLAVLGPAILPRAQEVSIDARVFGFMVAAVALISVGFGLVAARPVTDLHESLKSTRQSGGVRSRKWSDALVIAEVSSRCCCWLARDCW